MKIIKSLFSIGIITIIIAGFIIPTKNDFIGNYKGVTQVKSTSSNKKEIYRNTTLNLQKDSFYISYVYLEHWSNRVFAPPPNKPEEGNSGTWELIKDTIILNVTDGPFPEKIKFLVKEKKLIACDIDTTLTQAEELKFNKYLKIR